MRRRWILAAAVVIVAIIIAAVFMGVFPGLGPSRVSVSVTETVQDAATAPPGYAYYLLYVNVAYSGSGDLRVAPAGFSVADGRGALYEPNQNATTLKTPFPASAVASAGGGAVGGQLAFLLPLAAGESPAVLNYFDPASGLKASASVPPVSKWVTVFDGALGEINYTDTSHIGTLLAVRLYPVLRPGWYYTGDRFNVTAAAYSVQVASNQSHLVSMGLVLEDQAQTPLTVVAATPALPVEIFYRTLIKINVMAVAPAESYSGAYILILTVGV